MADFDPNPPSFNLGYTAGAMDMGSGYAKGIEQAGQGFLKSNWPH